MARFEFHEAEYTRMVSEYGRQARQHFADPIERDARRLAPVLSGELILHIMQAIEDDSTLIGSNVGHAAAQEQGARAHQIPGAYGRPAGVFHPGNPPVNFLKRALYRRRSE